MSRLPAWAEWSSAGAEAPWTVGIEEEVMLLDPNGWGLASRSDEVLEAMGPELAGHAAAETHGSALELTSEPHRDVAAAAAQLCELRSGLAVAMEPLNLRAAVAGTHPFTLWEDIEVSPGARYQFLYNALRELARREPTFGLHVHVALPDPETGVKALNRMRAHLPVLLALSANSPFWQGRETGLASVRTPLFQAFPRVGIPRCYRDYAHYVESIDLLLRCDAFPEPTFLWWDARLQPRFGTLEIRIMDAQTRVADTAALTALVQCLVRLEAEEGYASFSLVDTPEVLDENRFLAARDGMQAKLIDPAAERRVQVRELVEDLMEACAEHAAALGCSAELDSVAALADSPGALRQRSAAGSSGTPQLGRVMRALHADFSAARSEPAVASL